MKLILCLSDENGMMFNHRRESRDRVLIGRLLEVTGDGAICMKAYSVPLFPEGSSRVRKIEDISQVGEEEYFFDEDTDPAAFSSEVNEILLYRWNRSYPADVKCTMEFDAFSKTAAYDFAGSSHDCITEERYTRRGTANKTEEKDSECS
ncbi:MAG: ribonuclease Z [Lachnospiraceae bacterium]|nr:ribonuclease Z [Lachnospiraceae bacterium]